jgi:GTP-binding protein HflX
MPANVDSTHPVEKPRPRAVLVAVPPPDAEETQVAGSFAELRRLLDGLGVIVVRELVQRRASRSGASVLGPGKLRQLAALTGGPGEVERGPAKKRRRETEQEDEPEEDGPAIADLVVVDMELSPAQQRYLERATGVEVMDRTGTILRVFERRARTPQARLEVELARLLYQSTRVREVTPFDDREGGGGRGERGHSNVELVKRRIHHRVAALRRELEAMRATGERARTRRQQEDRVALVGYTNAGKSSIMRALTGSDVLVDDLLFATLDTTVRVIPGTHPRVLVSDTVGFLDNLPHDLIASFRSTLDEARDADLLLLVVDASDPRMETHLRVTREVLGELGAASIRTQLLLNKIDRVDPEQRDALREAFPDALLVSAHDPADVAHVRDTIVSALDATMADAQLEVPWGRGELIGEIRARTRVLEEAHREDGMVFTVRASPPIIARLERALARG